MSLDGEVYLCAEVGVERMSTPSQTVIITNRRTAPSFPSVFATTVIATAITIAVIVVVATAVNENHFVFVFLLVVIVRQQTNCNQTPSTPSASSTPAVTSTPTSIRTNSILHRSRPFSSLTLAASLLKLLLLLLLTLAATVLIPTSTPSLVAVTVAHTRSPGALGAARRTERRAWDRSVAKQAAATDPSVTATAATAATDPATATESAHAQQVCAVSGTKRLCTGPHPSQIAGHGTTAAVAAVVINAPAVATTVATVDARVVITWGVLTLADVAELRRPVANGHSRRRRLQCLVRVAWCTVSRGCGDGWVETWVVMGRDE